MSGQVHSEGIPELLHHAIAVHGGLEAWRAVSRFRLEARAIFPLLAIKGHWPKWRRYRVLLDAHRMFAVFEDYPEPGAVGTFDTWTVQVRDPVGETHARCYRPESTGGRPLRRLRWDDLDLLFFMGYALWNYHAFPFCLADPGFELAPLEPLSFRGERLAGLSVAFPADMPCHSRRQRFWFDDQGRLARMDYCADVIGGWTRGAHLCLDFKRCGGLLYPGRRVVLPGWLPRRVPPGPPAVIAHLDCIEPLVEDRSSRHQGVAR